MDFDDMERAEEEDAADCVLKKDYFPNGDDEDDDEKDQAPVEATVGALAKALTEERRQRRRMEKKLEMLTKQMEGMRMRVDESPSLWSLGPRSPTIHRSAYIAPGASVIGTVNLHRDSSVWFNCTVRGDNEIITIGEGTDIQDNSILHCDPGKPLSIGKNVLVGHQVCLHGCTVGDNCLIGMRTVMLDNSKVGSNCFVAAGSFIGENKEFGDGCLIGGNPAKKVSDLSPELLHTVRTAATGYVENKARFQADLKPF